MSEWVKVEDKNVLLVWECQEEDCDEMYEVEVPPGWLQNNGTPVCTCGADMIYLRTIVRN